MLKKYYQNNKIFAFICVIALLLVAVKLSYSFSQSYYFNTSLQSDDELLLLKDYLPSTNNASILSHSSSETEEEDLLVVKSKYLTNKEIEKLEQEQARIDLKYCGGPCRFINLLYVREQETRAQLHVRHFAFTAGLINRTVVLPNVSGSRIGACLPYDFEYYYDIEWAKSNAKNFKYITMTDFKAWLEERKQAQVPVNDQVLSIFDIAEHNPPTSSQVLHCFSGYTKPRSSFNQVMSWNIDRHAAKKREGLLLDFLRGPRVDSSSDLHDNDDIELLHVEVHKSNPFSHIREANTPIKYSSSLVQFADITSQSLGSYIAVHWRMERANKTENLVHCAEHLVSLLEEKNMNKSKVFLLTDYPHTFTAKQQELAIEEHATHEQLMHWLQSTSDTFLPQNFTSSHHQAIQYLFQHHPFSLFETTMESTMMTPKNWHLMPIPDSLKRINVLENGGGIDMIDSGWLGILDKLMAIRSHYFFAGKGDICGRGRSTFTAQIVSERKLIGKSNVHYFGHKTIKYKNIIL